MKTTITEGGQTSIPAELRHEMHLTPGRTLSWENISDNELRVRVQPVAATEPDPIAAIGFAHRHGLTSYQTTDELMRELRANNERGA